nr:MAG TPA: hypothetical protein [Caudoviricetes sp.]
MFCLVNCHFLLTPSFMFLPYKNNIFLHVM